MKCKKCGREVSATVLPLHMNRCNAVNEKIEQKETIIVNTVSDEIEIPALKLTKPMIVQELKRKGIKYDIREKKEALLQLLDDNKEES